MVYFLYYCSKLILTIKWPSFLKTNYVYISYSHYVMSLLMSIKLACTLRVDTNCTLVLITVMCFGRHNFSHYHKINLYVVYHLVKIVCLVIDCKNSLMDFVTWEFLAKFFLHIPPNVSFAWLNPWITLYSNLPFCLATEVFKACVLLHGK